MVNQLIEDWASQNRENKPLFTHWPRMLWLTWSRSLISHSVWNLLQPTQVSASCHCGSAAHTCRGRCFLLLAVVSEGLRLRKHQKTALTATRSILVKLRVGMEHFRYRWENGAMDCY